MRFCYGTFQAVMDLIRSLTEVWRIRDLIAHPLDPCYFVGDRSEQNKLSAMARGDGNLPGIMVTNACNMNPDEIANHFRDVVLKNLRSDMFEIAILALMDVIFKDDIGDDEIVDIVNGLTKKEFLACKTFVAYRTFAGLFIYSVRRNNNNGCKEDVDAIKVEGYLEQFRDKKGDIVVLKTCGEVTNSQMDDLISELDMSIARVQNNGVCPECGLPFIHPNEEGILTDYITYIKDESTGRWLPVCVKCKRELDNNRARLGELFLDQERYKEEFRLIDVSSPDSPLRQDLIATLKAISVMDEDGSDSELADPKELEEKIPTEHRFRKKVGYIVSPTYDEVERIINQLSGQNIIRKERLRRQIRRMWENTEGSSSPQSKIFDVLVGILDNKSGRRYHEACEILVSYYIQGCDVFAPPKQRNAVQQ